MRRAYWVITTIRSGMCCSWVIDIELDKLCSWYGSCELRYCGRRHSTRALNFDGYAFAMGDEDDQRKVSVQNRGPPRRPNDNVAHLHLAVRSPPRLPPCYGAHVNASPEQRKLGLVDQAVQLLPPLACPFRSSRHTRLCPLLHSALGPVPPPTLTRSGRPADTADPDMSGPGQSPRDSPTIELSLCFDPRRPPP